MPGAKFEVLMLNWLLPDQGYPGIKIRLVYHMNIFIGRVREAGIDALIVHVKGVITKIHKITP